MKWYGLQYDMGSKQRIWNLLRYLGSHLSWNLTWMKYSAEKKIDLNKLEIHTRKPAGRRSIWFLINHHRTKFSLISQKLKKNLIAQKEEVLKKGVRNNETWVLSMIVSYCFFLLFFDWRDIFLVARTIPIHFHELFVSGADSSKWV